MYETSYDYFSNLKHIYLKFPCLPKKNEKLRNEAKSAY